MHACMQARTPSESEAWPGWACVRQLKGVLMAVYFGADHVVWAGQAGLVSDKLLLERCGSPSEPLHIGYNICRHGVWWHEREHPCCRSALVGLPDDGRACSWPASVA